LKLEQAELVPLERDWPWNLRGWWNLRSRLVARLR
jgi:hypothetical protein